VTQTFTVTVNALPTISNIAAQSTTEDTPTGAIPFTIGDVETLPGNLQLRGTSSNPSLAPDQSIDLGGSGANRTVRIIPATNQFGSATITLTVTDESGASASSSFLVVVVPAEGGSGLSLLQIARLGNNRVLISWPTSAQGFTLQSGNGMGASSAWSAVADVPVVIGDRYYVTNMIAGSQRFYRLVQGAGLTIARSNANVIIAWPFPSTGYVLESRDAFSASASWTTVGATPIRVGEQNTVTLNAAGASQFYRLRRP
jgi:hypothetical protein